MLTILVLVEFVGCCLVLSVIGWLRYLYRAPFVSRDWEVRYLLPFLSAFVVAVLVLVSIQNRTTINQLNAHPPDVGLALGLGIALAVLVVRLVVEVGRYRTRSRRVSHGNQPYSRIRQTQRRAKVRRGKHKIR